jgi:uncharacterized protein (TIGR02118 family)
VIIFTVMYPNKPGCHFDMDYYTEKHLGLVKDAAGDAVKGVSVEKGLSGGAPGSPATYAVVCRIQFDSLDDLAVMAEHSPAFDADIANFTDIQPIFDIREVVV